MKSWECEKAQAPSEFPASISVLRVQDIPAC